MRRRKKINEELTNSEVRNIINSKLDDFIKEKDFDIIVSNPPYIKEHIIKTLSRQVQCEPKIALSGGEDGLYFYKKIIDKAYEHIGSEGYLCLEIGYDQRKEVLELFKEYKQYKDIKVVKDLSNNDRCIISKILL